jgi:hypothetical protein
LTGPPDHERHDRQWQYPMASGSPDASARTAPQKHSPEYFAIAVSLPCFSKRQAKVWQLPTARPSRARSPIPASPLAVADDDYVKPADSQFGRFSNRPFEVKHFQTIRHCNVDVAHGLALLFGIGTRALPSWDPRTRWNNLTGGLALPGPSDRADSPHPSSREGHHSTAGWSSSFLLSELICQDCHAAGTSSRVQRNSVPSTQMRCRMTASRRARATIAFFIPRRLAICIAQALSQDHFFERNMLCAAS